MFFNMHLFRNFYILTKNNYTMKRIYVIVFATLLSVSVFSCKEKSASEKLKDKMEKTGDDIEDKAEDVGDKAEDVGDKAEDKLNK